MLTQKLIEFIEMQTQDCFNEMDYLLQDYEETLNFVAEKLTQNGIASVVTKESEYGGTRTEIAPLFGFVIEGVHEKLLHQIEGILEATLVGWYQQKLME